MRIPSKKIYSLLVIASLALIISCSGPLDKKYSDKTFEKDMKDILASKKIDSLDMGYMAMYIMGAKFNGKKIESYTYRQILDSARMLKKNQGSIGPDMLPPAEKK